MISGLPWHLLLLRAAVFMLFCRPQLGRAICRCGRLSSRREFHGGRRAESRSRQHCVSLVKENDRASYLTGLLLSQHCKPSYFAVKAFGIETSLVKSSLRGGVNSDTAPAKMRMAWWRQAVHDIYSDSPGADKMAQPVVAELRKAVIESKLTRRFFEYIIDAKDEDIDVMQQSTIEDVESFSDKTVSAQLFLELEVAGVKDDLSDRVASHLGRAMGISAAISSAEVLALSKGEICIPQALMRNHKVPSKLLLDPQDRSNEGIMNLSEAVFEFATIGNAHMEQARESYLAIPDSLRRSTFGVFLRGMETAAFYRSLEECNFDIFDPNLNSNKGGFFKSLPVQMMYKKCFGSIPF